MGPRAYLNNAAVPVVSTLVAPGNAERGLILTTQHEEIPISGTIRSLSDHGAEITQAVLTQGGSPRVKTVGASKVQVTTYQPSTVITFYSTIGSYNSADQKELWHVPLAAIEGLATDPAFPAKHLWLPAPGGDSSLPYR